MKHVNCGVKNYRDILDNYDKDNLCSDDHKFYLQTKCRILCLAYINALKKMGKDDNLRFEACCQEAVDHCALTGSTKRAKNGTAVMKWHRWFRDQESFPCPTSKKLLEPQLFEFFPTAKAEILDWSFENFADLTTPSMRERVIQCIQELHDASNSHSYTNEKKILLDCLQQHPPSETTILRWMKLIGFRYDTKKKIYYVDGHEKSEQRFSRLEFSEHYLTKLEPRMCRWIQISKSVAQDMVKAGCIPESILKAGYEYRDLRWGPGREEDMLEFHVDAHEYFQKYAVENCFTKLGGKELYLGGYPSVRAGKKRILIVLGQDECVFHQYLIKDKTWVHVPTGKRPLLPKSQGATLMVSAFQG